MLAIENSRQQRNVSQKDSWLKEFSVKGILGYREMLAIKNSWSKRIFAIKNRWLQKQLVIKNSNFSKYYIIFVNFLYQILEQATTMQSFHSINKQNGLSLHQLSKWNQKLDNQRLKSIHAQDDLKKQRKLAKKNIISIHKQISSIQKEAVQLSVALQEQKTKWNHLIALVKNAEEHIYKQKLQKHQDLMNKKQPDEFQQQKCILAERQKRLEKIFQKLNSSQFQISKKVDLIRSLRSERSVHSNLLDKLQKQYFDVKFYYKQLLIERTLIQKQMHKETQTFNLVYHKSTRNPTHTNGQTEHKILINDSIFLNQNQSFIQERLENNQTNKTNRNLNILKLQVSNRSPEKTKTKQQRTLERLDPQHKIIDETLKLKYKKDLNSVIHDFGCSTFQQLKKLQVLTNINTTQSLFDQSNSIYEELFTTQSLISELSKEIHERKNIRQNPCIPKTIDLKSQVNQFEKQTQQTKDEIILFKQEFQKIINDQLKNGSPIKNSLNKQLKLNQKPSSLNEMTFIQNHQILREMMTFFNDQMLEFALQKYSQISRNRILRRKSLLNQKNKKFQASNLQQKVKIVRTQTEGSHNSTSSVKGLDYLDSILQMHMNICQKGQKCQKNDDLSILTEEDFIQESKKIIKQAAKKKSSFVNTPLIVKK